MMYNNFIIEKDVLKKYVGNKKNVIIPNGIKVIGDSAFSECHNLKSVIIPNSIVSINPCAFYDCTNLTNIIIPDSVIRIGYEAFDSCTSLTSIIIPNSVTYIGDHAFYGCCGLESNNKNFRFKATNANMCCRGFQYSLKKWFTADGEIKLCQNGFHSCKNPLDIFNYYAGCLGEKTRLWLVKTDEETEENDFYSKVVSRQIRFIKELTISELAEYTK